MLPEWAEEAELAELEELHVANTRIQPLDSLEALAASELKYCLMLLQPGLFLVFAFKAMYEHTWESGTGCAASLPWWMMGTGFIGTLSHPGRERDASFTVPST